jgi:Tfp pilus assembly protein PilF
MRTRFPKLVIILVLFVCCGFAAEVPARPLSQSEVLALVAGAALPENIEKSIKVNGLAFKPDAAYTALAKRAGATPAVLQALATAQTKPRTQATNTPAAVLEQLARAAELVRAGQQREAAQSLAAALQQDPSNMAAAFVMGQIMREHEQWPQAMMLYTEILRQDPEFPEAHTKLAYIQYRMGDGEEAIAEARSALRRTPENAEANKNLGLGLDTLRQFDAAILASPIAKRCA